MRTEGSEQEDVIVNCQVGESPKVGEKSPKWEVHLKKAIVDLYYLFEKGHTSIKK